MKKLKIGDVIDNRYQLESVLGGGGFGIVYRAIQTTTGQYVALKLLHFSEDSQFADHMARFERELWMIAKLRHPNIVRLIDTGRLDNDRIYAILEYIEGQHLSSLLKKDGALAPREARNLMIQVLDALSSAHGLGIVHRDLKPENIMITTSGIRKNAIVLDFGISGIVEDARDMDYQSLTMQGQINGTPAYMSPEQLRSEPPNPQNDIYSWGLVFLECLIGRSAVSGDSLVDILAAQVSPNPIWIPAELASHNLGMIISQAIEKDLKQRYSSAREVLRDLDSCFVSPELMLPWTGSVAPDDQKSTTNSPVPGSNSGASNVIIKKQSKENSNLASRIMLLIVLCTIAIIAVVSILFFTGDTKPESVAKKTETQEETKQKDLDNLTQDLVTEEQTKTLAAMPILFPLVIDVSPKHAKIFVDGRSWGEGKVAGMVINPHTEHVLWVNAKGYSPQEHRFFSSEPHLSFSLKKDASERPVAKTIKPKKENNPGNSVSNDNVKILKENSEKIVKKTRKTSKTQENKPVVKESKKNSEIANNAPGQEDVKVSETPEKSDPEPKEIKSETKEEPEKISESITENSDIKKIETAKKPDEEDSPDPVKTDKETINHDPWKSHRDPRNPWQEDKEKNKVKVKVKDKNKDPWKDKE